MEQGDISRRLFLIRSIGGISSAWFASNLTEILAAHKHAQRAAQLSPPGKFEFFSPEQAAEVEAVAAQIIPSDTTPGAREAHVIYFIDRALFTFDRDKQALYTKGLAELQARIVERFVTAQKFSDLTPPQQIELLKAIEKTEFFEQIRVHTITGFFANPEYGGNYAQAGWKLIGFEDSFTYEPPFGYYDQEYNVRKPLSDGAEPGE